MTSGQGTMQRSRPTGGVDTVVSPLPSKAGDPDAALVERLRRQETGSTEALVAAYSDRVYRLAIRITGNSSDAEEVVQDTLWAAIRKIDTFRGSSAFGSWVYRITANAACQKRRSRRTRWSEVAWDDHAPSFDQAGQHVQPGVDWSPRLKDPVLQAELRSVLSAAVEELPEEYRAPFLLRDVEGLSTSEIAGALELNSVTVKSRVHRARLFLRAGLAEYMDETPEFG